MGLKNKILKALISKDQNLTKRSSKEELLEFVDLLRPRSTTFELLRIGGKDDGGYLIPDDVEGIKYCFSPGVSEVSSFEQHLADQYAIHSYMVDASVENPPISNEFFHFEKKFLGTRNEGVFVRLESWLQQSIGEDEVDDLILQMDIEGAEYDVLIDTSLETLKRFRIIVIEFHHLDYVASQSALRLMRPIFEKIGNAFTVVHLHPNNYKKPVEIQGIEFPRALEVTFLRNDRIQYVTEAPPNFPHPLDRPNLPNLPDFTLPRVWW